MDKYLRTMSLDLGEVRIGIAISDIMNIIANGLETYTRQTLQKDVEHVANIVKERGVGTIVMGLPINMDGTKGERVEKTYAFAEELKKVTDCKIDYMDERLTTVTAERVLIDGNVRRDKRKQVIDKLAATIILQSYLDMKSKEY
jgi:putative Holliday junction resolvase